MLWYLHFPWVYPGAKPLLRQSSHQQPVERLMEVSFSNIPLNRVVFRFLTTIKWFPCPTWRNKGLVAWNLELLITVHFLLGQGLFPRSLGNTDNIPHCVFSSPPNPFLPFPLNVQPSLICMLSDSTACRGESKMYSRQCIKFLLNHRQQKRPNHETRFLN